MSQSCSNLIIHLSNQQSRLFNTSNRITGEDHRADHQSHQRSWPVFDQAHRTYQLSHQGRARVEEQKSAERDRCQTSGS